MKDYQNIIGILVGLIGFFIIFRELVTWYLKQNKIVELLNEQNNLLKAIFQQLGGTIEDAETDEQRRARRARGNDN